MNSLNVRPCLRGLLVGVCLSLATASAFASSIPSNSNSGSALTCGSASSSPGCIPGMEINSSSLTLIRYITGGVETDDIRGVADFAVFDPGLTGWVEIADPTLGTDPGFATLDFGNPFLYAYEAGVPLSELSVFYSVPDQTVASGAPITVREVLLGTLPGPVTSRPLRVVTYTGPFTLGFNFVGDLSSVPGDQYLVYSLASATLAIPEPSSMLLAGLGMLLLFCCREYVRRKRPVAVHSRIGE